MIYEVTNVPVEIVQFSSVSSQSDPFLIHVLSLNLKKRVTQPMPLLEQELLTLLQHLSSSLVFSGIRVAPSLVFCVVFCRSLYCLSFFNLWLLITPLVSLNFSYMTAISENEIKKIYV